MKRFIAIGVGAAALIVFGGGLTYSASNWTENGTANESVLAERLSQPDMLFNAQIEAKPSLDSVAHGRLVAMGGSEKGGAGMACFSCHGPNGSGDGSGAVPRIGGMPAWYMYKQLNDYTTKTRVNEVMTGIAANLTDREKRNVSAYYALMQPSYAPPTEYGGRTIQRGQRLAAVGSADSGIPACANCHGAKGFGMPPSVPYLAGQYADYITIQLKAWKAGERSNDPMNVMAAIAKKMSDEDIRAVARYYERVRRLSQKPADKSVETLSNAR
jgi:cytochrome c553